MEGQKASPSGLWRRHFFHVDPGHWMVARGRVSTLVASTHTLTDPESHPNSALAEFLTDSFDVTYAVWISCKFNVIPHNKYAINGWRGWALCTIEGEIPPIATAGAATDAEIAIPKDTQRRFVGCFLENTFLWRNWKPLFYCVIMICRVLLVSIVFSRILVFTERHGGHVVVPSQSCGICKHFLQSRWKSSTLIFITNLAQINKQW